MEGALAGIRVIDLAQHLAGPGTCMYLADQGADVIKVEPRLTGDASRQGADSSFAGENSRSFLVLNRNKRGITIDIRQPRGREVLLKLIGSADVLVHNLRRRVTDKFGLTYEELHERYPRLIYGWISAFGSRGPYADKAGYDRLTQGLSGAMSRRDHEGLPITAGVWVSDCSVPMLMAYGVTLALWAREKTGLGQQVETSLLQAAVAMQSNFLVRLDDNPTPPIEAGGPGYGIYRCGDGAYINVCALQQDQFQRFCLSLELNHLADDPRFTDARKQNELRHEVYPIIDEVMRTRTSAEWLEILDAADVPCAPILQRAQVIDDPRIVENEYIVPVDHPKVGRVRMMGVPIKLSMTPGSIRRPSPSLGEHTDEVLGELGYSPGDIEQLRSEAVI
jgi:crotonobetainyl-CoA:carnitine CoA-transferase CaiB-like acyl-CoA transferase